LLHRRDAGRGGQDETDGATGRAIDAEVDLGPIHNAFGIAVRLDVSLPGMERDEAQRLIEAAHLVCPYSNATRGNIDIEITLA
jgi:organic hydroperoxide reductase OsmC/OhrA